MNRLDSISRATAAGASWDVVIIGGGATGLGTAVDAAARGLRTLLLERSDFGKGTSSRSTKLIHGGVRYLQQGNLSLVLHALRERELLLRNAPHLVRDLAFVLPQYARWEAAFYGLGLKLYDLLARSSGCGSSRLLSRRAVVERLPAIQQEGLRGGVLYHDGQFDDARLLVSLAHTATEQGAAILNYATVTGFRRGSSGALSDVVFRDEESGVEHAISARVVINAAGPFADEVRRLDEPASEPMLAVSQGIHLVLPGHFLAGQNAMLVPRTSDGRVMFAIPWHGHTLLGTTDTPVPQAEIEPRPRAEEIDLLLQTASGYFTPAPKRADVLSIFTGLRPLVKAGVAERTAQLSRDHTIRIARSGLITITGGKWTTYRKMAEDVVDRAVAQGRLEARSCCTRALALHGAEASAPVGGDELDLYGSDAPELRRLMRETPALAEPLHPALAITSAQIVWAARREMARTVEDVLARRTRALFLNAGAALEIAPRAAELLAAELGRDAAWQAEQIRAFSETASRFVLAQR